MENREFIDNEQCKETMKKKIILIAGLKLGKDYIAFASNWLEM